MYDHESNISINFVFHRLFLFSSTGLTYKDYADFEMICISQTNQIDNLVLITAHILEVEEVYVAILSDPNWIH